ncbi:MAG: hypothetical protein EBR13_05260, partial [Rhodobacteraceae bacterium]|nr:hypothetical protein [Paracoccaceae bacterium]
MVKITDFDDAYQNGAYIPDADGFITRWTEAAANFRASYPPVTHHYGTGPRQYFDLFMPDGAPNGLSILGQSESQAILQADTWLPALCVKAFYLMQWLLAW